MVLKRYGSPARSFLQLYQDDYQLRVKLRESSFDLHLQFVRYLYRSRQSTLVLRGGRRTCRPRLAVRQTRKEGRTQRTRDSLHAAIFP